MANLREFWDEMKDGDEVKEEEGGIAYKDGYSLRWKKRHRKVSTFAIIHGDWTLVKPKHAEIETERWMRCDEGGDAFFFYRSVGICEERAKYPKNNIENMKNFLYWDGEDLPYGGRWPRNSQMIWIDFANKSWASCYNKEAGHTEQLVAGWAVMRKEG